MTPEYLKASSLMNGFEEKIMDLSTVDRLLDLALEESESGDMDRVQNVLITAKQYLDFSQDKLLADFKKSWDTLVKPLHQNYENYYPGCCGDTLTEEEIKALEEGGINSLKSPW
jgi:hypothetical protein